MTWISSPQIFFGNISKAILYVNYKSTGQRSWKLITEKRVWECAVNQWTKFRAWKALIQHVLKSAFLTHFTYKSICIHACLFGTEEEPGSNHCIMKAYSGLKQLVYYEPSWWTKKKSVLTRNGENLWTTLVVISVIIVLSISVTESPLSAPHTYCSWNTRMSDEATESCVKTVVLAATPNLFCC